MLTNLRSDETTAEDTLCILRAKNLIDEKSKLPSGNNELVDNEISATPFPRRPGTPTKDTNKLYDIVLSDINKDLMRHVNGEVENLKALIDNEFTIINRSIDNFKRRNFITDL